MSICFSRCLIHFRPTQAGQVWPHCVKRSSLHSIFALQKIHIRSLLFPFPRKPALLGFARSHTCSGQLVPRNLVASQWLTLLLLMKKQCTYRNDKSTASKRSNFLRDSLKMISCESDLLRQIKNSFLLKLQPKLIAIQKSSRFWLLFLLCVVYLP